MPGTPVIAPELMAPAGDWDCVKAAVENGADAVYFGLQGGFNARARAVNFTAAELPALMTFLRTRGVKGYLTLNTLVFGDELEEAERIVRLAVAAGVDAVLVQDIGLLRLIHRLCPELPLHASTQMTLSSAECIRQVESLGVRRVVLPRELSIAQIAAIRTTDKRRTRGLRPWRTLHQLLGPMSGESVVGWAQRQSRPVRPAVPPALRRDLRWQALLPSPFGRGAGVRAVDEHHCARLTLTLSQRERADRPYPFSPHDLAAYDRLPELIAAGVSAFKIEGRLKPAEYVASVTRHYRAAIDAAVVTRAGRSNLRDSRQIAWPRWRWPFPAASATAGSTAATTGRWSPVSVRPSAARTWAR